GADSCERAVVVEQAQLPGLLISNGEFVGRWGSKSAVCLEIAPQSEGKVSLVNCSFWGPIDRCVWMRSKAGQFSASACHFVHWDNAGKGSPAIQLDAGRAIVQGCTFLQDAVAVEVGPEVTSAILFGNQAVGGFQVENSAGDKAQISLNEPDPIRWTPEARAHYTITVGAVGDGRYLRGFHGPERSDRPFRWSSENAMLILPVLRGKPATVTVDLSVPAQALAEDAGVYLGNQRLAGLLTTNRLVFTLPACGSDKVQVGLRARLWVPQRVVPGSKDQRKLGLQLFSVTVKSDGAGATVFDANTGQFVETVH
ncbi:MAG TPA: hypothetical protein PLW35_03765, partial [Verrucomicrobiota bacterium]|nr:hypothetical protein [Verrucomicrobiota bacterium]